MARARSGGKGDCQVFVSMHKRQSVPQFIKLTPLHASAQETGSKVLPVVMALCTEGGTREGMPADHVCLSPPPCSQHPGSLAQGQLLSLACPAQLLMQNRMCPRSTVLMARRPCVALDPGPQGRHRLTVKLRVCSRCSKVSLCNKHIHHVTGQCGFWSADELLFPACGEGSSPLHCLALPFPSAQEPLPAAGTYKKTMCPPGRCSGSEGTHTTASQFPLGAPGARPCGPHLAGFSRETEPVELCVYIYIYIHVYALEKPHNLQRAHYTTRTANGVSSSSRAGEDQHRRSVREQILCCLACFFYLRLQLIG